MHVCDGAGVARLQGYAQAVRYGISALCMVLGYRIGSRGLALAELTCATQVAVAVLYVWIQWRWLRALISTPTASPCRNLGKLLRGGLPFLTLSGASTLLERGDVALAAYRLSPELTANYAAAAQLVIGLRTLVSPLQRTSFAALSASARESEVAVRRTARVVGTAGVALGTVILIAGEWAARPVVTGVYGIQYIGSVVVVRVLLLQLVVGTAS